MTKREQLIQRIEELREEYKLEGDPVKKERIKSLGLLAKKTCQLFFTDPLVERAEEIFLKEEVYKNGAGEVLPWEKE